MATNETNARWTAKKLSDIADDLVARFHDDPNNSLWHAEEDSRVKLLRSASSTIASLTARLAAAEREVERLRAALRDVIRHQNVAAGPSLAKYSGVIAIATAALSPPAETENEA
jgi:predicted RNA-binding Zn ribbon-like protein